MKNKKKKKEPSRSPQPYPKIALVGFRGVGKSSAALGLEAHWNTQVISLDARIEEKFKKSIQSLVSEKGWGFFREKEALYLKEISERETTLLLDTGGGVVETGDASPSEENIHILKERFFSVYLYLSKEKAMERLKNMGSSRHRPLLEGNPGEIYDRREPLYRRAASSIIDVSDASAGDVVKRILGNF